MAVDMEGKEFFIVGLDGRKTPDPEYWYDRWECILAKSERQAKNFYIETKSKWLREDEYKHVEVFGTSDEFVSEYEMRNWIANNIPGAGTDRRKG